MEYKEQQFEMAKEYRAQNWHLEKWQKRPALVSKKGSDRKLFFGQPYETAYYELVTDGWNHDHCEFCSITISDFTNDDTISKAYTNGSRWICPNCYQSVIINNQLPAG